MLFPIWDDKIQKTWVTPWVSYTLIVINVLVFFHQASLSPDEFQAFVMSFGTIPKMIMSGDNLNSLFTNMFLHGWWMHLIGNMMFLRIFGDNIEARMWNIKFLIFYVLGGLAASFAHIVLNVWSTIPAVGASGAISAVLWAYLVMYPKSRIKMIYVYHMRIFYLSALQFLWYWIVLQIVSGVGAIWATGWGTARWAHIWWFVFGTLIWWIYGKQPGYYKKRAQVEYKYK